MKLTRILTKIICFIFYTIRFKRLKTAWLFANYQLSLKNSQLIATKGNQLLFLKTGNRIPLNLLQIYSLEINLLARSLNYSSVKVVHLAPSGFVAEVNGIQLWVKSIYNLFTLHEIFQNTLYGISTSTQQHVVLDIGMNVGFASLYFASLPSTSFIYGYEPFPETYHEAQANFNLNPTLKQKIRPYNYGISNRSDLLQVPTMESGSAVTSINELFISSNQPIYQKSSTIAVEVKSIVEVMHGILQNHPGLPIYLKVDCEGEEYAIFEALEDQNLLVTVSGVLLEWHIKGPAELERRLKKANFTVLSLPILTANDPEKPMAGMLYGFK